MKLVIDIDDDYYERIKHDVKVDGMKHLPYSLIANGTPLPKGHGRLIDADALEYFCEFEKCISQTGTGCNHCQYHTITEYEIDNASTIIEADKEE